MTALKLNLERSPWLVMVPLLEQRLLGFQPSMVEVLEQNFWEVQLRYLAPKLETAGFRWWEVVPIPVLLSEAQQWAAAVGKGLVLAPLPLLVLLLGADSALPSVSL